MIRGPYETKRKKAKTDTVNALAKLPYQEFVTRFYNGMTVKDESARLTLAETAATLRIEIKLLLQKQAKDTAGSEDVRALPAITRELRKTLEAGGMLADKFDPDLEDL